jgi:hypothetical protein
VQHAVPEHGAIEAVAVVAAIGDELHARAGGHRVSREWR